MYTEVKMTKIAYNGSYGGFGLSEKAIDRYVELKGIKLYKDKEGGYGVWTPNYYTVPVEEYLQIAEEDDKTGNYERSNAVYFPVYEIYENRTDPILIQVIEELGADANGLDADLRIAELTAGTKYHISEYDGMENVMTPDDYKWNIA
jgi:hypothetical protein